MDLIGFRNIDGVPIHYARAPVARYGTRGKGPRYVRLDRKFHRKLQKCLADIWKSCPWGSPEILVSGGCYVEKAGAHGLGRAIDIDAIWWSGEPALITNNAPKDPIRYLSTEAVLRQHFGNVLNYWYNGAHQDHWHVDDKVSTSFRPRSRAQAVFMQASLNYVFGQSIGRIDGIIGKRTSGALSKVMEIPISEEIIDRIWKDFMKYTANTGFSKLR